MRIIGGRFKGKKFIPPAKNWPTRPTTDFAKESLFNILNNRLDFEECTMLDLFGGTGNHSYEFISRGCMDVTFVDSFAGCTSFVINTSKELGIDSLIKVVKSDVFRFLQNNKRQFGYIFAGPPYPMPKLDTLPDEIFRWNTLAEDGLFVLEHDNKYSFVNHTRFVEERKYGMAIFSFFK